MKNTSCRTFVTGSASATAVLLFLLLVAVEQPLCAQRDFTADSIAFVNAYWHNDTLD